MPDGAFRGLTIGRGDVALVRREGIHATPPRRATDVDRVGDGVALGITSLSAREVLLVVGWAALTEAEWKTKREVVRAAFRVGARDAYTFDDESRQVDAIVTALDIPEDFEWPGPQRMGTASTSLLCPDPRILSTDTDTVTLSPASAVPNAGNVEAPFVWTVNGPATIPAVERSSDLATIAFDGTVGPGSTLVVDLLARTAELDGDDVWHFLIDSGAGPASLWGIEPGGSTLTASVTSSVDVYAGAWL